MIKNKILSSVQQSIEESNKDFLQMNIDSLKTIVSNAQSLLESLEDPKTKSSLTQSWLQGKIEATEDYMSTIYDFVKSASSDDDTDNMAPASLWENIRKKKLREGKNYKPAKPGDKDRPNKEAWKRAQNS